MVESGGFSSDIKIPGRPPLSTGRLAAILLTFKHKFWKKSNPTLSLTLLDAILDSASSIDHWWSVLHDHNKLKSLVVADHNKCAYKGNIGESFEEEPFRFKSKGHLHISLFASVASLPGFFSFKDKHYFTEWRKSLDGFLLLFPK